MNNCYESGIEFVNISPLKSDIAEHFEPEWIGIRPNTDAALMLAIAYVLLNESLYDEFYKNILSGSISLSLCQWYRRRLPKNPLWASKITGVPVETIIELAYRMAECRTMIMTMELATW